MSKQFKSLEEAFSLPVGSTVIDSRVTLPSELVDDQEKTNVVVIPEDPEKADHIVYDDKDMRLTPNWTTSTRWR